MEDDIDSDDNWSSNIYAFKFSKGYNIAFMYYWTNMLFCRPFNIFIFNALISFEQLWICVCYLNGETFMNNYRFVFVIYILIIPYTEIFDIIK